MAEQVEDQWGGDVVGQVAHHLEAARWHAQLVEVELQGVALVQAEIAATGKLVLQDRHQVLVQFHHVQLCPAAQQAFGQGALAGADFQQMFAGLGVDGTQDAVDDAGVVQEVLAEALARPVLVLLVHGRFSAIW